MPTSVTKVPLNCSGQRYTFSTYLKLMTGTDMTHWPTSKMGTTRHQGPEEFRHVLNVMGFKHASPRLPKSPLTEASTEYAPPHHAIQATDGS
jgi:hypothetical protein